MNEKVNRRMEIENTERMGCSMEDFKELLKKLNREEEILQFTQFINETAYQLGNQILASALKNQLSLTIDICRGKQQLFHYAMNGTTKDNDEWIKRKNRVVNRFFHSSYYMAVYYNMLGTTIQEKALLDPTKYAAFGGAFPIIIQNVGVVGTVTVSGLPHKEDHEFVVGMLKEFLQKEV
ncbi:MAG: heme-degrading domain-containing protein [Paenibacillaceae bacterium]